jgi:hypothetical protein
MEVFQVLSLLPTNWASFGAVVCSVRHAVHGDREQRSADHFTNELGRRHSSREGKEILSSSRYQSLLPRMMAYDVLISPDRFLCGNGF